MLDGTDAIDWAALEHAYGPADDVPDLLRAAGSADPQVRDGALRELSSSLCHQGSVYSATAAAVPFVARLALDGPGDRLRLLWLLHGAAGGAGREERQVRRAVAAALPPLLVLAADGDPSVRRSMVWIIAACEEASLPLMPLLRARLAEEGDAGLLPAAARPAVEHIARSPRRVVSGFLCDGTPHPDLTARRLARELLVRTG
ncbi:hypothetical protein ACWEPM_16595 [Streptomyces sp. NPDC004244]